MVTAQRPATQICRSMTTGIHVQTSAPAKSALRPPSQLFNRIAFACPAWFSQPVRTKINFSMSRGKPSTVKQVTRRFMRLDTGLWIRTQAGHRKQRWKKSLRRRLRLSEHIFCNKSQCQLLDKMTTKYWKRQRFIPNDPYAPYHRRTGKPEWYYQPPKFLP